MLDNLIRLPYLFNIIVLLPVCTTLFLKIPFQGGQEIQGSQNRVMGITDKGYKVLVTSLWTAILVSSLLGVFYPKMMVPILIAQVIYKAVYILWAELPAYKEKRPYEAPMPLILIFIFIIITYPVAIAAIFT